MVSVVITITDEALDSIQELAIQLQNRGLQISRILPGLGIISGVIADESALDGMDGIKSIGKEMISRLPDKDSPIQ